MRVRAPLPEDVEVARNWRNRTPEILRTSFLLTEQMQKDFYHNVVCDRKGTSRFYSVVDIQGDLLAFVGIENIQWENRLGEISCVIKYGYDIYMPKILDILLDIAFKQLNLVSVYTEVYECSPYFERWDEYGVEKSAYGTVVPFRKFWDGRFYDSVLYTFVNPAYENLSSGGDKMDIEKVAVTETEEIAETVVEETTDLAVEEALEAVVADAEMPDAENIPAEVETVEEV